MNEVGCGFVLAAMLLTVGMGGAQQTAPPPPPDPVSVPPQTPSPTPAVPADAPVSAPVVPAQGTAPAPPADPASLPPQTPSSTPGVPKEGVEAAAPDAAATPDASATPDAVAPVASAGKPAPAKDKKGKEIYTGPTTVVVLEPTPMLDEEGKQRLDPEGKPMFNPPVSQQRDKKGHPLFDDKGKPVFQTAGNLGYDENGKKISSVKEKKVHTVTVAIVQGTLTVDGLTGKAGLNYQIPDLKYIYLYVPWIGMTIVSNGPFPGAVEQRDAFRDTTLTVKSDDHVLELSSEKRLLGKQPQPAYVLVDRDFKLQSKFPMMGYGTLRQAPYEFPGSKVDVARKGPPPPPLPVNLRPGTVMPPCPVGQMRPAGAVAIAGQPLPACEAIKVTAPKPVAVPLGTAATTPPTK